MGRKITGIKYQFGQDSTELILQSKSLRGTTYLLRSVVVKHKGATHQERAKAIEVALRRELGQPVKAS